MNYNFFFSPPKLKELLALYSIIPKKSLGQNFLFDKNIVDKIITAADITKDDTVVEIGAGLGVLTYPMALRARRVVAYEIDKRLIPILEDATSVCGNVEIRNEDIRNFQFSILNFQKIQDSKFQIPNSKFIVVGNLPYYMTSRILRQFLEEKNKPTRMVVTVQKEVAKRIVARPPKMSLLSVMVQFYGKPKIMTGVSRNCFLPRPEVNSAIVVIDIHKERAKDNENLFFTLAKAGFGHKRKSLAGNLSRISLETERVIDKNGWENILLDISLSKTIRAQELSCDQWMMLSALIQKKF